MQFVRRLKPHASLLNGDKSRAPTGCALLYQDIMAREQRLLGEDIAQFLSRLESQPVPPAAAMALTMQQLVDTTFPVSGSICIAFSYCAQH